MSAIDLDYAAPPHYLEQPPARAEASYGLFSVARQPIITPDVRWQAGVEWEPDRCDEASGASGICFDSSQTDGEGEPDLPEGWPLATVQGVPHVSTTPFTVYGWYNCSSFSRPEPEAVQRATNHLLLGEERQVENAIASGVFDNEPSFQDAVDLTPGGAVDIRRGVGLLEGRIGTHYGAVGVIHMPRSVAAFAHQQRLMQRRGRRLETELGNLVVAGAGYDLANIGPDGNPAAAGTAWLYATGVPSMWRSDIEIKPTERFRTNFRNNDLVVFAFRIYTIGWECITAAAQIQLPELDAGE